jgi:hypothetical protein
LTPLRDVRKGKPETSQMNKLCFSNRPLLGLEWNRSEGEIEDELDPEKPDEARFIAEYKQQGDYYEAKLGLSGAGPRPHWSAEKKL